MSIALQSRVTELEHALRVFEARLAEIEKHEQQRQMVAQAPQMPNPAPKEHANQKKKHWL